MLEKNLKISGKSIYSKCMLLGFYLPKIAYYTDRKKNDSLVYTFKVHLQEILDEIGFVDFKVPESTAELDKARNAIAEYVTDNCEYQCANIFSVSFTINFSDTYTFFINSRKDIIDQLSFVSIHCGLNEYVNDILQFAPGSKIFGEKIIDLIKFIDKESPIVTYDNRLQFPEFKSNRKTSSENNFPKNLETPISNFFFDNPKEKYTCFLMMRFGMHDVYNNITNVIKSSCKKYDITCFRADDKEYTNDLFNNVLTYIHACDFGIAIFDRIEEETYNPNVALEVGYMTAIGKPILFLKDRTLKTLQADLVGKLYKEFDPFNLEGSIPKVIDKWLIDQRLIKV